MDFSNLTDADLFRAISEQGKGDAGEMIFNHAIGELFDRYGRLVYSIALRAVQDRFTAEEITQDVFLKAFQRAPDYDPGAAGAAAWLACIARRRAIDELRRRRCRPEFVNIEWLDEIRADILPGMGSPDDPEKTAVENQESRLILELARSLPREQFRVISLACFGGYTQVEIARLLGVPLGTVKSRMRTGLRCLRDSLAASGILPEKIPAGIIHFG